MKRPAGRLLAFLLSLTLSTFATAQEDVAIAQQAAMLTEPAVHVELSLEEAIERALASNEEVLLAAADERLAAGRLAEVRSALRPDLGFDLDYTRNIEQPVFFLRQGGEVQEIQVGSDNEYDLALTLSQPLFDARLFSAARAAELARQAAAAGVSDRRTAVALVTRLAYYDVLLAAEQTEVQRQALAQAGDRLAQVEELFGAGTAAEFDVLTAEVEVENIRPDLIEAENSLRLGLERLKRIVGLPPAAELEVTSGFVEVAPEPSLDEALAAAFAHRDDLAALELAVAAQEQRVERERRSNLPRVDLSTEVRRQASTDQTLPDDLVQSSNAQVQVSVPFFQGGSRKARVAQEEAVLDAARLRLEQRVDDVRLEVQQSLLALRAARQSIDATRSNVHRAERALDIARVRFTNGLSTQLELSEAELAVTRARSNYAAARYAYSAAWAGLQAALGEAGRYDPSPTPEPE